MVLAEYINNYPVDNYSLEIQPLFLQGLGIRVQ